MSAYVSARPPFAQLALTATRERVELTHRDPVLASATTTSKRRVSAMAFRHRNDRRRRAGHGVQRAALSLLSPHGPDHDARDLRVRSARCQRTARAGALGSQRLLRRSLPRSAGLDDLDRESRRRGGAAPGRPCGRRFAAASVEIRRCKGRPSHSGGSSFAGGAARSIDGVLDLSRRVLRSPACTSTMAPKSLAR